MVLMKLFTRQQWRHRHREQTYGHRGIGEDGEGGVQRVTWKHTLTYVKQIANGSLLYDSGNSNHGSVTIQRGEKRKEVGQRFKMGDQVCLWLICVDVWQKQTQYCKVIILQLNKFFLNVQGYVRRNKKQISEKNIRIAVFYTDMFNCCKEFQQGLTQVCRHRFKKLASQKVIGTV